MSQWKNTDDAANSVLWAVEQYKVKANTTTRDAFFGNTTADAYITGITVGQYGISTAEAAVNPVTHAGWVVKTEGSGGRAGRVSYETLVAMSSITGDSDSLPPAQVITISDQPDNASANASAGEIANFSVTASAPAGTLSYAWQYYTGSAFANLSNAGAYSNVTTSTLSVLSNTAPTGEIYRVVITNSLGGTATSANAVLTVTTQDITITGQPANTSANSSADEIATFTVVATAPVGVMQYAWQSYDGSNFVNLTNTGAYSNVATNTLAVLANTASNGEIYRVVVTNTLGGNATSANAVLTITT